MRQFNFIAVFLVALYAQTAQAVDYDTGTGIASYLTSPVIIDTTKTGPVQVTYASTDPVYTSLTQLPGLLSDAFQDMKNYLGLNILKYSEMQARLDAIIPPNATQSRNNGGLIAINQAFVNYWQQLFYGSAYTRNLFQQSTTSATSNIVGRHLINYCSNQDVKYGICTPASTDAYGDYLGGSDLTATSILGYLSFPNSAAAGGGLGTGNPSPTQIAANDFLNNLTNPQPTTVPSSTWESSTKTSSGNIWGGTTSFLPTTSAGDTTLASLYQLSAIMSVPQAILANMIAERTQIPGLGTSIGAASASVSALEALEYEATRRFESEAWHDGINSSPAPAVLREIANMNAMQLAMQFRQIQQNEEIEMLLAAIVSATTQTLAQGAAAQQSGSGSSVSSQLGG